MAWYQFFIALFAFTIMVVGLIGIVLPFFPGIEMVWFGVFLYAVATGFNPIGFDLLALLAVPVLLSYLLEFWSVRWGVKQFRSTPFGVLGAVIGGLVGSFFGLFPALTAGPIIGAVLGEMLRGRDSIFAIETDHFKIVGFVGSTLVKLVLGVILIGVWIAEIR